MSLRDADGLRPVLDPYAVGDAHTLVPGHLERARRARRALSGELQPLEPVAARERLPKADYLITRKADGEFALLVVEDGEAFLVNPGGTVRVGLPLLDDALEALSVAAPVILAGELMVPAAPGGRERVHDVVRTARSPADRDALGTLHFSAFDVLEAEGAALDEAPLADRWARLEALVPEETPAARLGRVPGGWGLKTDVFARYEAWEGTSEGVVARSDRAGSFKIKAREHFDVAVIGYTVGADDRQALLHDFLVAVMRPADGHFHVLGRVGGGFNEDERRSFAASMEALACASSYIETSSEQVAYTMVRPEWVIEISALDFIAQTSSGFTIDRMVVSYDASAERWSPVRRLPLGSLISPLFIRRREDKAVHPADVGLEQVTRLYPVERADEHADDLQLPTSELLRREVWLKETKTGPMVRKLLLWRTNKEAAAAYPAYVVYGTDFSPNRQEPLQRDMRVTNDGAQAERLYEALKTQYVKRGWEAIASGPPAGEARTSGPLPI